LRAKGAGFPRHDAPDREPIGGVLRSGSGSLGHGDARSRKRCSARPWISLGFLRSASCSSSHSEVVAMSTWSKLGTLRLVVWSAVTIAGCGGTVAPRPTTPPPRAVVAAEAPAPAPAPYRRVALEGSRLRVDDSIVFETGSAVIDRASDRLLVEIADELRAHPEAGSIRVEGHTDRIGRERYNRDLSERRAQSIVERLVSLGVPADRLHAAGIGSAQPIAPNDTDEGRALNRRVELVVVDPAAASEMRAR
jgi:outer membrane protein OmpA-like peptidoglycan-associated protein